MGHGCPNFLGGSGPHPEKLKDERASFKFLNIYILSVLSSHQLSVKGVEENLGGGQQLWL